MILGYPAAVIPTGEHPANAKCRRGIHPPFSACKTTPAVRKIHLIFPTAFTGCNTLHFALQSRVPDVPSGLPYGRAYALLSYALRLRIKECRGDGYGSCKGVSQNNRHHRHQPSPLWEITRRRKEDDELCPMQSCVSRNAKRAALQLANATMSGRKKPTKAIQDRKSTRLNSSHR